jgi:hypothetical protein
MTTQEGNGNDCMLSGLTLKIDATTQTQQITLDMARKE